jgi:ribokinase
MFPKIVVFGSLNMDFVVRVPRLPSPGETALGSGFQMIPGGKGANQACAVGRIGSGAVQGSMVGRVGYDVFADHLKASLSAAGVDVSFVHATKSAPTGVAFIWVEEHGQNSIVVAAGANHSFTAADVEALRPALSGAKYALFQLESPLVAVEAALKLAHELGATTILDPAPAHPLSEDILVHVDILTPNESEASLLLGRDSRRINPAQASEAAQQLLALGCGAVVLKLGDSGCLYYDGKTELAVPAFAVEAVDTTAAGDIFNASLAVALTENKPIEEALRFANAAAALSVTKPGAQTSVPTRNEVVSFLLSRAAV